MHDCTLLEELFRSLFPFPFPSAPLPVGIDKQQVDPDLRKGCRPYKIQNEKALEEAIHGHIHGSYKHYRIGAYTPWLDVGGKTVTSWIGIDVDGGMPRAMGGNHATPIADIDAATGRISEVLIGWKIPHYTAVSRSGSGRHIWIFLHEPVEAWVARTALLTMLKHEVGNVELAEGAGQEFADATRSQGLEVFPKSGDIGAEGTGNMLFLPYYFSDEGERGKFLNWNGSDPFERATSSTFTDMLELYKTQGWYVPAPLPKPSRSTGSSTRSSSGDSWRSQALAVVDLSDDRLYGDLVQDGSGWRPCRVDEGDRTPSASVADGVDGTERGVFKAFRGSTMYPDLPVDRCIDIFEWLKRTGRARNFFEAREIIADVAGVPLPTIKKIALDRRVDDIAEDGWSVLLENAEVGVFSHHRHPVEIVDSRIEPLTKDRLVARLHRGAEWGRWVQDKDRTRKEWKNATAIPKDIITTMRELPGARIEKLSRLVRHPVLIGDRLVYKRGHDRASGIFLTSVPEITMPDQVTQEEAKEAAASILDDIYGDFPFRADGSKAHVLAALLTPILREETGIAPAFVVSASMPGSGKSLLCQTIVVASEGEKHSLPPVESREEMIKRIETKLMHGASVIHLDNLNGKLYSKSLASLLTDEFPDIRVLGKSEIVRATNHALWLINGNNPALSGELARRPVTIRLEPTSADPHKRKGLKFDEQSLIKYVLANRSSVFRRLLIMVKYWLQAGKPQQEYGFGSYNQWASIVGQILELSGVQGFLQNRQAEMDAQDDETADWLQLTATWFERFRDTPRAAKEILKVAEDLELFEGYFGSFFSEQSRSTKMGNLLSNQVDRIFGEYFVRRKILKNGKREYYLEAVQGDASLQVGPSPEEEAALLDEAPKVSEKRDPEIESYYERRNPETAIN